MGDHKKLAEHGGIILSHFRHPEDWRDGADTGKLNLMGTKVLKVELIRLGGGALVDPVGARLNASAIRAFALSRGLPPHMLTLEQVPDKVPYVVVPDQYFNQVIAVLKTLRRS